MIILGIAIIIFTLWDISRKEADTGILTEFLLFFNVKHKHSPVIFWTLVIAQLLAGLFFIVEGVLDSS
jgi:hypothetical protein